jgi:hypothetical protein
MKKFWLGAVSSYLILAAESAFCGSLDPAWMFSDTSDYLYQNFQYCDTARKGDYNCFALQSDQLPDSGDKWIGKYINCNYQLKNDTIKFFDDFDKELVRYKDYRACVAGFKTAWEGGMVGFPLPRYKYLVFAHKGPNAKHKVTVKTWFNDGSCGAPSFNEFVGTFNASDSWKLDSIEIPEAIRNKADKERNTSQYYEFTFIITNIDDSKTPSEPSNLKMDDLRLTGYNPIDESPKPAKFKPGESTTLTVKTTKLIPGAQYSYQWKKDGVAINGATQSTYAASAAGKYTVDVKVAGTGYTFTSWGADVTESGMCGGGALLALLPPICFKAFGSRKKKKQ